MGRTTNKQRRADQAETARQRAAAARLAQQRAEQRRRALVIIGSVVGVVVVVAVIALIAINNKPKNSASGNAQTASSTVVNQVTKVSDATLNTIGSGNTLTPPAPVSGQPPLTANGKPQVLYIGAEFCPYCAVYRWSLVEALSRFGTFSHLGQVRAAASDGNFASLDFKGSSYSSPYLTFTAIENEDRDHKQLEPVTSTQDKLWSSLSGGTRGYPFVDFGNKYVIAKNAPLDPAVLGTLDQQQIAAQLNNPNSKIAQTVGGGANQATAAICSMTGGKPANVCSSSAITAIQNKLGG